MCKCEFSIGINLVRNPQRCYNCLTDFENKLWKPRKPHQRFSVISFVEPVYIGAANNRGNVERHFPGNIDEVRIYDRPLTAAEVTRNFIVDPKNKWTLSAPGRFGFLTEPAQDVQLILNFTINRKSGYPSKQQRNSRLSGRLSRQEGNTLKNEHTHAPRKMVL